MTAASALAASATVAFGIELGQRRAWLNLRFAALAGTAVLVCSAEALWLSTLSGSYAGGSGGVLSVIVGPFLVAVFAGVLALAGLGVMLGVGALVGMAMSGRPALRVLAAVSVVLAGAGAAALAVVAPGPGGSFGVLVAATRGKAAGEWKGPGGAVLMLAPDGRFTASGLPAGIGDWSFGATPVSGAGTWHIGSFDGSGLPPGVIFDFSNGAQAELQLETDGPSLAMYYDRGDPDEGWSGQYRFVKH